MKSDDKTRRWTQATYFALSACFWASVAAGQTGTATSLPTDLPSIRSLADRGDAQAQELLVEIYENRCRPGNNLCSDANTDRSEAVRWIKELAREDRKDTDRRTKATYQTRLAWKAYFAATPAYSPVDPNCVAAVDSGKLAIANGNKCAGRLFHLMYRLGHCVARDEREAAVWSVITVGCPQP